YIQGEGDKKYQMTITPFISGTNIELASGKLPDNGSVENELMLPLEFVSVLGFDSAEDAVGKSVALGITAATGVQREVEATVVGVQEKSLMNIGGANLNDTLMRNLVAIQNEGKPEGAPEGYMAFLARVDRSAGEAEIERIKGDLK